MGDVTSKIEIRSVIKVCVGCDMTPHDTVKFISRNASKKTYPGVWFIGSTNNFQIVRGKKLTYSRTSRRAISRFSRDSNLIFVETPFS